MSHAIYMGYIIIPLEFLECAFLWQINDLAKAVVAYRVVTHACSHSDSVAHYIVWQSQVETSFLSLFDH